MANRRESCGTNQTAAASEKALTGAILAADIAQDYEEYLAIFDRFYSDDIEGTTDTMQDPVAGKAALRARLAGFLMPLHVFAENGGVSVSLKHSPINGDRTDETHGLWTLELLGATGARCSVTWCSRRRWRAGRIVAEHHYDHRQIGGPLTLSDLHFTGTGMPAAALDRLA